jgi:hypothetical protein
MRSQRFVSASASCAATKTLSRSSSVAVMYMTLRHDERLSRPSVGASDDGGAGGAVFRGCFRPRRR